jgi:hypothetical protein
MGVDHTRPSAIGTPTLGGYSTPKRVWLWFFQPVLKFLNVVWWTSLLMFRGGNINVIYLRQHLFLFCTSFGNKITAGNSVIVCFKTIKRGEKQHKCEYYKKKTFFEWMKIDGYHTFISHSRSQIIQLFSRLWNKMSILSNQHVKLSWQNKIQR